jgi:BirA family transcriptional regulator, biotin operon repressor / biotin---[acetyl-CoA-carboxylase] ligase
VSDLSAEAVARALDRLGASVGRPLVVAGETASTNDDARVAAAAGAPHGAAFLADAQTAGRGRGGHTWHSPPGENLYISMIARPRVPASSVAPVALVVGVAIARVIEARGVPVWIKWPNDVLAGEAREGEPAILSAKKLAGVLVEGQLKGGEVTSLVIGAGVNVRARSFPPEIAARATSLAILGVQDLDRSTLAAEILAGVGAAVARFEADRLDGFLADLGQFDALVGARVEVSGVRGVASGIDDDGLLLVRRDNGVMARVGTGEVKLVGS